MTSTESAVEDSEDAASASKVQRLIALGIWVSLVVGYVWFSRSRDLSPLETAEELRGAFADNWWGPALFVAVYAIRPLVLFPATIPTILAGLAFGLVWGTVWTVIGSNLSVVVAYLVGRYVLRGPAAERLLRPLGSFVERARRNPFETAVLARLLYLPYDPPNFAAGLLSLPLGRFLAGSFLGALPGTMAYVGFGASVDSLDAGTPSFDFRILLASIALAIGGIAFSQVLKRRTDLSTDSESGDSSS